MKHVKLFEGFINEGYETGSDIVKFQGGYLANFEKGYLDVLKSKGFITLGEDIFSILGPPTKVTLFSSGYYGLSVEYKGRKFLIMDQPGKVGLEDQTMPYISLQEGSKKIIQIGPDSRGFGHVQMEDEMRKDAYLKIKEYFQDEYENITGHK